MRYIKKTKILNLALYILVAYSCKNPKIKDHHIIQGDIKKYESKIYLIQAVDSKYYFNKFQKDSTLVINGKFEFRLSNEIKYPLPFYLISENGDRSEKFILEPKSQRITLDSLHFNVKPKISNEGSTILYEQTVLNNKQKPLLERFMTATAAIANSNASKESYAELWDIERKKLSYRSDSVLVYFVKEYPDSYFSFWQIINALSGDGYTKEIEKAYNNLSAPIKETEIAKIFFEDLKVAKSLSLGNYFPEVKLKNKDMKDIIFQISNYHNSKYILVDFWFSYCSPCIRQFPGLKSLYKKYNPYGLEIIGISTDRTSDIENWKKIMEKNELNWINLLDENSIEAIKLSINKFPTNFLLNREGIILKKDISLEELEKLLK
jgi:peroxiredoxin